MKKWLVRMIQLILIAIILYCGYQIGTYVWSRYRGEEEFHAIEKKIEKLRPPVDSSATETEKTQILDYRSVMELLRSENTDSVMYLEIQGTKTAYPVVQAKDNDFYLRRNMKREYNIAGTLFLDYENRPDLTDQNTVIYGHMFYQGDQMFGVLKHFLDQEYTDQSPKTFTLVHDGGINTYRIFSIYHVAADAPYRNPNTAEDEWADFLQKTAAESETNMQFTRTLTAKDRVVTLSTCTPNQDDSKRLAIVGVLESITTDEGTVYMDGRTEEKP
ncbi:MAG: class B sortase [Peptoniphilaceae bacterium]|nr:class B sortase [Peptoniphilaceae bacterium]MDY5765688.1 class B sortase [Peptoniphilaceae bacterium]